MQILKGILFFRLRTLQKQTNDLSAAGWALPAGPGICARGNLLFCNVHGLKKMIPLKIGILSCLFQSKSVLFNLFCVSVRRG